ncbi:MAG: aminoacyl-histidine dipeptidase [Clostridia bacterium]|nr:aminoacyl-histidine dipeptidase [Clostridia bacterium]
MEYTIKGRNPSSVFRFFEEISAIPRGSYNEAAIADYLVAFAKERGLFVYRDGLNNVLIKAPATKGWEERAPILFQGHTDMVCEKNGDVEHDFLKDPIRLWVDGDLLRAKGTTLGADNGIAVAMMLALLDGEVAEHPAYECLFTTAEEVGLNGAQGFDYSLISARRMLNLDSERLGEVTCGCAGGVRSELTLPCAVEPFAGNALSVKISGLIGGHSGDKINAGRANANKLMGRLLASIDQTFDWRLVSLSGGSKDNAIPRECAAVLATTDTDALSDMLMETAEQIARELSPEDRGFTVTVEDTMPEAVMLGSADTEKAVCVLACAANGVLEMSRDIEGLVEYSRNLGVVYTENESVTFVFSSRSSIESQLDASINEIDTLARTVGAKTHHHGRYPGWSFAKKSPLRDAYLDAYRQVTGKHAAVTVIHAGLECGIIHSKIPDMDVISIGPTMYDIHSPDEALDLPKTELFWQVLVKLIESS